jgi:endonuclease/exonuclease/phosphatase family metal-dependent hydrolase
MFSFRVATYNIHKCRGLDRRVRPRRISEVLLQLDADVIALQEVVGLDEAARERNQVRAIADELGYDFCIGENRRHGGAAYGNAVLSRFPIIEHRNFDITRQPREPRGCLQVRVACGAQQHAAGCSLEIYNVHLGTGYFERRYQAGKLLEVLDSGTAGQPRILLGDFNEWTRGLASRLFNRHFSSAEPSQRLGRARSYPGILPFLHLDHIYHDAALELTNVSVHRSRRALLASDHLPLVADFRLVG